MLMLSKNKCLKIINLRINSIFTIVENESLLTKDEKSHRAWMHTAKRDEWMSHPFINSLCGKSSEEGNLEKEHIHRWRAKRQNIQGN